MPVKAILWMVGAALSMATGLPAGAQAVYKCGPGSYSQYPCSKRVVNTGDAPVPRKANPRESDVRRLEQNRALAGSTRRLPGEAADEFQLRRHRATLLRSDRDECARLDTRIPLEQARMKSPMEEEVRSAEGALSASKKRFQQLRC